VSEHPAQEHPAPLARILAHATERERLLRENFDAAARKLAAVFCSGCPHRRFQAEAVPEHERHAP
jgi:TPP-dependent indolepyruvate ferredoxin oxidoreductase alpha subunit